jgi:tRNA nucleotidyltransferase/poly(A) polymerase
VNNVAYARAADIATAIREAGGRALVVGGWVRDSLMGRESNSKDIDLEVYGLTSDRVRSLLRCTKPATSTCRCRAANRNRGAAIAVSTSRATPT